MNKPFAVVRTDLYRWPVIAVGDNSVVLNTPVTSIPELTRLLNEEYERSTAPLMAKLTKAQRALLALATAADHLSKALPRSSSGSLSYELRRARDQCRQVATEIIAEAPGEWVPKKQHDELKRVLDDAILMLQDKPPPPRLTVPAGTTVELRPPGWSDVMREGTRQVAQLRSTRVSTTCDDCGTVLIMTIEARDPSGAVRRVCADRAACNLQRLSGRQP